MPRELISIVVNRTLKVGWKYGGVVASLEAKRKARGQKSHVLHKARNTLYKQAKEKASALPAVKAASEELSKLGYSK